MLYQAELRSLPEQAVDKLRDRSRIASVVLKFLGDADLWYEGANHEILEIREKFHFSYLAYFVVFILLSPPSRIDFARKIG